MIRHVYVRQKEMKWPIPIKRQRRVSGLSNQSCSIVYFPLSFLGLDGLNQHFCGLSIEREKEREREEGHLLCDGHDVDEGA